MACKILHKLLTCYMLVAFVIGGLCYWWPLLLVAFVIGGLCYWWPLLLVAFVIGGPFVFVGYF